MDSVVVVAAQALPFVPVLVAVAVWLLSPRGDRRRLAGYALAALAVTAALVILAGLVHDDPRPFVTDPRQPPLFPHAADNGFPSDHTAYSATFALLVALRRRRLGAAMVAIAVVSGVARVLAHVHHLQDVGAAVVIAVISVLATTAVLRPVLGDANRSRAGHLHTEGGST